MVEFFFNMWVLPIFLLNWLSGSCTFLQPVMVVGIMAECQGVGARIRARLLADSVIEVVNGNTRVQPNTEVWHGNQKILFIPDSAGGNDPPDQ